MIDTVRGVLRVRKWPKKRGPPKSAKQRFWVDWFIQANLLAKYADGMSQARAIAMTKGTGLYPRDVLLSAMRGRLYWWADETGWKWFPMAATQDVSDSLDTIAQAIGSVLVRAVDRWRAPVPGAIGAHLTYQGDAAAPTWEVPAGGVIQALLAGTPIIPDGSVSEYILDVSAELSVSVMLDQIGQATSGQPRFRFSTDGGVSYHSGGTDYTEIHTSHAASGYLLRDQIWTTASLRTTNHYVNMMLENLRVGRAAWRLSGGAVSNAAVVRTGFLNIDGAVTHVKVFTSNGSNFNAGTIRAVGLRAA